jgi:homoserine dehydrogenase
MQAKGIAEADASLDVDGWDAAAKAAALANVLLGARLTPAEVDREGITRDAAARALRRRTADGG